jgi:uncharacterized protein
MIAPQTLSHLKSLEAQLRADGVCALYLFGSHARGDATDQSDIDLMFEVTPNTRFSLFDQARIGRQLGETLHAKVDFIPRRALHHLIKARIEAEMIKVFD